MAELRGVLVPMLTPFDRDGAMNEPALRGHVDWLIESGVHGLVPAGSTGEAISLDRDEYVRLVEIVIDQADGRVPVIAGCSANATRQVVANVRFAEAAGADAVMAVHPFYSRPDPDELAMHYATVAESTSLPIIVYNNPVTSGVDASPELLGELSRLPTIRYVKESSGDSTRIMSILERSDGRIAVLCGSDNQALENFACGATGWVAGAANVFPRECVALYDLAVVRREYELAFALYRQLFPFFHFVESTGKFVQANKAAAERIGRPLGQPRSPLQPLPSQESEELETVMARAAGGLAGVSPEISGPHETAGLGRGALPGLTQR